MKTTKYLLLIAFLFCFTATIIAAEPSIPDNEIHYTSTDGNIVTPYDETVFGANIISNTYENGEGIITFDGVVTSIGESAFDGCSSLTSITIPHSVTSIGNYTFYYCSSLTSITIPESITSIGESAFSGCYSLTDSINIPNGVTTIEAGTFSGCSSLASITIPESITSIGHQAFWSCSSLASITIPNGVTTIGDYAFYDCHSLVSSISIPYGVTTIGEHTFYGCVSLPSISIPNSVTSIGYNAFKYCYSFTSVIIPNSVTSIENSAFQDCLSLTSVTIGSSVMTIGSEVFDNCPLDTIYCYALTPPELFDEGVFANYDATLYIPCEALDAYKADSIWGKFSNIQCVDSENPPCEEVSVEFNATFCGSFVWNGVICTEAGDYVQTIRKTDGCDSIVTMHLVEDCPISPIDPCEDIIELDWRNGVQLSQLSSGWYKLYVGDIHANQSAFTIQIVNDLACPATMNRAYYANCEDSEAIIEGSVKYELGKTIQTMSYADFADIVAPHVDYLYLNITDIVEDSQKDTIIENITDWVCDGGTYEDILGEEHIISSYVPDTHTWSNTIETDTTITIYNYTITPIVPPTIMTNELLATIHGATPVLIAGKKVDVTGTLEAIMNYYKMNDTEAVADVESVVWAAGANVALACDAESHTMILKLTAGCDFELNVELLFEVAPIEVMTTTEAAIICEGETYQWQGISCSETGSYTYEIWNEEGCVVGIKVLELTVIPAEIVTTAETATICEGESYTWAVNGITYENLTTGVYSYKDTTMYDCTMEINTLQLTVEDCAPPCENVHTEEQVTICYGDTYTWNGQTYATEGAYTMTFYTNAGCDSTVTLYLTVLPATIIVEESVVINEEYLPYTWRDLQYYDTGTYTISTPFADYPYCDSVIYVLNLTVEAPNKCGDNLYWHYSNNTMTITGYGAMYDDPDLLSYRTQGWYPSRVTHVSLSNEITHIGDVAFADCANLTCIVIPSSVTSIGDGAFSWTGLQSITIPASVTELGEQVFEACNDLHTILYEGNPIAINNQTVHPLIGCVHLDTVITPAALWHCTAADPALEARYGVPHKAHYIEVTDGELTDQAVKYIAQNATTLEILDLTNATNTTLPYGAWSNCYQLTQLYLPEVIETLPESMIEGGCGLLEIAIPAAVTEIGNYAFAGCVNVWRMTVDAVIPPKVYENTFDGISRSISVQIPAGSEELYREAEYWREFFVETNAQQSPQKAQKILHEDQILILRNGKVYTTMGQLITNE